MKILLAIAKELLSKREAKMLLWENLQQSRLNLKVL
jgi:hypothetical protein